MRMESVEVSSAEYTSKWCCFSIGGCALNDNISK